MAFIKFKPVTASFNFYSQIDKEELTDSDLLYISQNEKVAYCFKSSRDLVLLTNLRIILIDKKGFMLPMTNLGGHGLFVTMIVSILSVEILRFCKKKNVMIKMREILAVCKRILNNLYTVYQYI